MGLDFYLFEVINYDGDNVQKKFEVEEVLYLSNSKAMLVTNWLYRNDSTKILHDHYCESDYYKELYGYTLEELQDNLKTVLDAAQDKRDLLALFYFPCLYTVGDWVNSAEMFSEHYYENLTFIYERIDDLLKDNATDPEHRYFLYKINW